MSTVPYVFLYQNHLDVFLLSPRYFLLKPSLPLPVPFHVCVFSWYVSTNSWMSLMDSLSLPKSFNQVGIPLVSSDRAPHWWVFPSVFPLLPPTPTQELTEGLGTCCIPPNKNSGSQPVWRRKWQPTPVLPRKFCGQRNPVGSCP